MKSIVNVLGTDEFTRIRIGIGMPIDKSMMINYVIGKVSDEELEVLSKGTTLAKEACIEIVKSGVDSAMNKFN